MHTHTLCVGLSPASVLITQAMHLLHWGPHKPTPPPHIRFNEFKRFKLQRRKLSFACV